MPKPSGSNKQNLERTRAQLISKAKSCFAKYGYAKTSTNLIIKNAESSRGSLYHHFSDKKDLFKTVYDAMCQDIAERITSYPYKQVSTLEDLIDGCIAYLETFTDKAFSQIMLIDGPHVLGNDYCRSKDAETAYKELYEGVNAVIDDKERAVFIADFLSGALDTYALRIALSARKEKAFAAYSNNFRLFATRILSDT